MNVEVECAEWELSWQVAFRMRRRAVAVEDRNTRDYVGDDAESLLLTIMQTYQSEEESWNVVLDAFRAL